MNRNDAICIAHTYHFADLAVRGKATAKRILGATLFEDADRILDLYNDLVEGLAEEVLPDEWQPRNDYWGGKCFSTSRGWGDPKSDTIMAGERNRYLCADSEAAIREHMQDRLVEAVA